VVEAEAVAMVAVVVTAAAVQVEAVSVTLEALDYLAAALATQDHHFAVVVVAVEVLTVLRARLRVTVEMALLPVLAVHQLLTLVAAAAGVLVRLVQVARVAVAQVQQAVLLRLAQ
jgi:hypothetical protein